MNFLAEGDDGLEAALALGVEDKSVGVSDVRKLFGGLAVAQRMVARIRTPAKEHFLSICQMLDYCHL